MNYDIEIPKAEAALAKAEASGSTQAKRDARVHLHRLRHQRMARDKRRGALRNLPLLARPPKGYRQHKEAAE